MLMMIGRIIMISSMNISFWFEYDDHDDYDEDYVDDDDDDAKY